MKEQIERALVSGVGTHQGATLPGLTRGVRQAMVESGLIGLEGGLTRKGSILAARIRDRALDEAFA